MQTEDVQEAEWTIRKQSGHPDLVLISFIKLHAKWGFRTLFDADASSPTAHRNVLNPLLWVTQGLFDCRSLDIAPLGFRMLQSSLVSTRGSSPQKLLEGVKMS